MRPSSGSGARRLLLLLTAMAVLGAAVFVAGGAVPASAASVVTFLNKATTNCLDSNDNGNVYSLPCNGGNYQNWQLFENFNGGISIQDAQTGRCLGSDSSGNISTWYCFWLFKSQAWYV